MPRPELRNTHCRYSAGNWSRPSLVYCGPSAGGMFAPRHTRAASIATPPPTIFFAFRIDLYFPPSPPLEIHDNSKLIVTLTINPAIDRTISVDRLAFEDRARISSSRESAGGRGINASCVIHSFGG